jgi:NAD(P)H-hydrate repair Nnr-like enzyme with NAD(P)H-hydrate dehydratase domain
VQCDRFAAIEALRSRSDGAVILKGNGSLVAGSMATALSRAGNPGMASGGMGDVLSGIVGSLLGQGLAPEAAARLGCELHAVAGDRAAAILGERALLGSDLIGQLPGLLS